MGLALSPASLLPTLRLRDRGQDRCIGLFKVTELGQVAQRGSHLRTLSGCKAHVLYRETRHQA